MKPNLKSTLERIVALCTPLSIEQAEAKISPDTWSISEIVEHLAIVERGAQIGIRRSLSGAEADEATLEGTRAKIEILTEQIPKRTQVVPAPEAVVPTGRFGAWPAALESFQQSRLAAIELEETDDVRFESRVMPHPRLGALTLRQWFQFLASHTARHALQIEEQLQRS